MTLPRIRAAVALENEDGVLLVRHQKGAKTYWLLPGGGVDYGEPTQEAARREMTEETGLEVEIGPLLLVGETISPDGNRHVLHLVFRGRQTGGSLRQSEDHRVVEARFVPLEQLSELVIHPPLREPLVRALRDPAYQGQYLGGLWID